MFRSVGWRWTAESEVWSCRKVKSHQDEKSNVRTVSTLSTAFSDDLNWWLQGSTLPPLAFVGIPQFGPLGFQFIGWRTCAMTAVEGQTDRLGRSLYLHCQLNRRHPETSHFASCEILFWHKSLFGSFVCSLFVRFWSNFFSQNWHLVEGGLL